jgi:hypothetical protein
MGESLVFGIIMIFIGLLITLPSLPMAMGRMRASRYNWLPIRLPYRMTDEEKDQMGKPTAKAAIVVGLPYGLAGLAIVAIGLTGNASPSVMYLFIGASALMALAFVAIAIWMVYAVKRWRVQGETKLQASR